MFFLALSAASQSCDRVISAGHVSLHDSIYHDCTASAVIVDVPTSSLDVVSCTFVTCQSPLNGGALFFSGADLRLTTVCADRCSSAKIGAFAFIKAGDARVAHSRTRLGRADSASLSLTSGSALLKSVNSSHNIVSGDGSGVALTADQISLSHCAFFANGGRGCIGASGALHSGIAAHLAVVGNRAEGLLCLSDPAEIQQSVFLRNTAEPFVRAPAVVFQECVFDRAYAGLKMRQCRVAGEAAIAQIDVQCFAPGGNGRRVNVDSTPTESQSPLPTPEDEVDIPWGFVATILFLALGGVALMTLALCDQHKDLQEISSSEEEMLNPAP